MGYLHSLVIGGSGWVGRYLHYYGMLVVSISLEEFVLVRFFSCLVFLLFCAFVLILETLCSYYYLLDYPLSLPTSLIRTLFL